MKILNTLQVVKRSLQDIETQYNLMVQVDYLMGLCVATVLGMAITSGGFIWFIFLSMLAVSLILGYITIKLYQKMMKKIIRGK